MLTRFITSAAVCSVSDSEGSTILNVDTGLVYSLIGVASRTWTHLVHHPQGLTFEELITPISNDFPQIDQAQIKVDTGRLLRQLQQNELVQTEECLEGQHLEIASICFRLILKVFVDGILRLRLICLAAFLQLFFFDLILQLGGFRALHHTVKNWPLTKTNTFDDTSVQAITAAMDRAIRYYPRHSLCLQRSAALTCLLRSCEVPADMVIACRRIPFKGHAWVEVDGNVVNDSARVQIVCNSVLERC